MADTKNLPKGVLSYDEVRSVSPALEAYTKGPLLNGLWKRPELSPRDRSLVTVVCYTVVAFELTKCFVYCSGR